MISVPRPAMLVAIVTAPYLPACATIIASRSWCLALSTSCLMPLFFRSLERYSDFSTETVPTRTGCPFLWHSITCSITALNLPFSVLKTTSGWSTLITGLFVGISITSSLYISLNSSSSVRAVPVIPDSLP